MTENEKYKLSTYQTLEVLHKTETSLVELTECSLDGRKYVKKTYNSDKRSIFNVLSKISSPFLPKIQEIFFGEDTVVIEEYVEGTTLERLLEKPDHFDKRLVLTLLDALLSALSSLHKNGIVHRDIKPSNIIVKSNGQAVLTDFSIARIFSPSEGKDTEQFGTVGYAAPEQFGFAQSDFRTDIYALGITLQKITNEKNASKAVSKAISRCCEFDPRHRFQNVGEIKNYLERSRRSRLAGKAVIALLCVVSFSLCAFIVTKLISPQNHQGKDGESQLETGSETDFDELLYVATEDRIIDVWDADAEIPCLQLRQPRQYSTSIALGKDMPKVTVSAEQTGSALEIVIDGSKSFSFSDDSGLPCESYPDGSIFSELIFYDMNNDGTLDIIPVMCNAVKAEWEDGSVVLLKNYSMAWCICCNEGKFEAAEGIMISEIDPLKIYASMPGCVYADFPSYYRMENGSLVLY